MTQSIPNMSFTPNYSFLAIPFFACACWAWHLDASSAEFILSASGCCCCVIGFACSTKMERPWLISIRVFGPHNAAYYFAFFAILSFAIACWAWNSGAPQDVTISAIALGSFCCVIAAMVHRPRPGAVAVDSSLFDEPPPRPDCDICFLPMPLNWSADTFLLSCCGKEICFGCHFKHFFDLKVSALCKNSCPFCRCSNARLFVIPEEISIGLKKRAELGDASAMTRLALWYMFGKGGLSKDEGKAFKLCRQAADLGHAEAYSLLGSFYSVGEGVVQDVEKARKYFALAAMKGHAQARFFLGQFEHTIGNKDLAVRHWRISAAAGHGESIQSLSAAFDSGFISEEFLDETKQAFEVASETMQSDDRSAWSLFRSSLIEENSEEPQSSGNALFALNMVILFLAAAHVYYSIRNKWLLPTLEQLPKSE